MVLLSKSRYMDGLQCPKLLWYKVNDRKAFSQLSDAQRRVYEQGTKVGELACKRYSDGLSVGCEYDSKKNAAKTAELLELRKPLFEAGFIFGDCYCRVDILVPSGDDEWDLIEVKSTTSVKDAHINDVSFQLYCLHGCGIRIRKCFLMHINNKYIRDGDVDVSKLFVKSDIADQLVTVGIGLEVRKMLKVVGSSCPDPEIGVFCDKPYKCDLKNLCWKSMPENNVFDLCGSNKLSQKLFEDGVELIADITERVKLNSKQQIQRMCSISGEDNIDKKEISNFFGKLEYPLNYLDFETYASAVPMWNGVKPYQNIPFQFSLHIQKVQGGELAHYSFLAKGKDDCRKDFVAALKKVLGKSGSVVVYNKSFEISRLRELALVFPEYDEWVEDVVLRIVDLWDPFKKFSYYSLSQKGSASIKKVLPAVTGKSYDGMDIADGMSAAAEYLMATFEGCGNKDKIYSDLEKYCCLDTEGMVWIVDKLRSIVED